MGSTFVGLGEVGFWMRDGDLEVWLRLLALHLEDPIEPGTAQEIRDRWLLASRGDFNGCVPDGLEEAVATEQGARLVRAAVQSLLAALERVPARLSKDVFNLMGFSNPFTADIESRRMIDVGRAFLDLLDGKITTGPRDTVFVPPLR